MFERLRYFALVCVTSAMSAACPAHAQRPDALRVNTFPNATNLALFIGEANGVFAKAGLKLDIEFTQNS